MSARDSTEELMAFIQERWQQEQQLDRYMGWRALRGWLRAEIHLALIARFYPLADDMAELAAMAHQYCLDLEPQQETPA